jgi:large subunit ribosomal protein L10
VIKGGVLDGKFMTPDDVRKLADLESREVLLAKVAGAMQGVLQQAISLVSAPLSQAARLFAALEKAAAENPSLLAGAPETTSEPVDEEATSEPTNDELAAEAAPEPTNEEPGVETISEPTNEELAAEAAPSAASAAPEAGTTLAAEPLAAPAAEDN